MDTPSVTTARPLSRDPPRRLALCCSSAMTMSAVALSVKQAEIVNWGNEKVSNPISQLGLVLTPTTEQATAQDCPQILQDGHLRRAERRRGNAARHHAHLYHASSLLRCRCRGTIKALAAERAILALEHIATGFAYPFGYTSLDGFRLVIRGPIYPDFAVQHRLKRHRWNLSRAPGALSRRRRSPLSYDCESVLRFQVGENDGQN